MSEDLRDVRGAHWGTCRTCGTENTWICTQTEVCMSCKFPSANSAPVSKMVETLKKRKGGRR